VNDFEAYQPRDQDCDKKLPGYRFEDRDAREAPVAGVMSPKPVVVRVAKL